MDLFRRLIKIISMLQSFSISLNGFLQNKVNFWTNCKKEIFKFLLSLRWAKYACCKAAVEHGCHIWTGIQYVLGVAVAKQISLISLSTTFFCFNIIFGLRSIQYCLGFYTICSYTVSTFNPLFVSHSSCSTSVVLRELKCPIWHS